MGHNRRKFEEVKNLNTKKINTLGIEALREEMGVPQIEDKQEIVYWVDVSKESNNIENNYAGTYFIRSRERLNKYAVIAAIADHYKLSPSVTDEFSVYYNFKFAEVITMNGPLSDEINRMNVGGVIMPKLTDYCYFSVREDDI